MALLEAAVSIYDQGYTTLSPKQKNVLQENIYIKEVRKSKTVDYKAKIYTRLNLLEEVMRTNDVRYLNHALDLKTNKYELEKVVYLDKQLVYIVKTEYPWLNRIFVDTESFAILQIETDARWEGLHKNEWKMDYSIMNRAPFIKKTIKFKKYEGKYFMEIPELLLEN